MFVWYINFRPPMAMGGGAHQIAIWRPVDAKYFHLLPLIFVRELPLSQNHCCCGPLLPILQSHVQLHPRCVWYEIQAANGIAFIVHTVYIDNTWVAAEYLRRCKAGSWKKENTAEAVACWNFEHILDAEQRGQPVPVPEELTMDDLVMEDSVCSK